MYERYQNRNDRRENRSTVAKSVRIFWNVAVMCGTCIVVALTIKVIMSIFM